MRMADWMLVLLATVIGFGAYLMWVAGAPWQVAALLAVPGLALGSWAFARAQDNPQVVLVGRRDGGRLGALEYGLDEAGYAVRYCEGPSADRPCPVLAGQPCRVHGHPEAALLYVGSGQAGDLPPCGRALAAPVIAVEERPGAPAAGGPGIAAHLAWGDGAAAAERLLRTTTPRSFRD